MEEESNRSWGLICVGLALFGFAWFVHGVFANLELNGGSVRINWMFALLYKAIGKWGVVGVISFIAAATVWRGWTSDGSVEAD